MSQSCRADRLQGWFRATAVASVACLSFVAACSDARDTASLTGLRQTANNEAPETLDGQITLLIGTIIEERDRSNITDWWLAVKRKVAVNDPRAHSTLLDLSTALQTMADRNRIIPRPGETPAQAAAHLVLLMSLYVHAGPATPPPEVTPEAEATLAIVSPAEEQTVQTPSKDAGVTFAEGAVDQPTIVVITRNEQEFPDECSGPLPTTRCQYPEFYKFDVFPDVKLNSPALVAVCHVNTGHHRMPRADHERFRIAHQKPSDPAAYHPEGTIEGDIEILPLVNTGELTDCEGTEHHHASVNAGAGLLERFATRSVSRARHLASGLGRVFTPRSLHAIDRGGGGSVLMFSDFAVIDPLSQPDVFSPGYFSASQSSVAQGASLTVTFNLANDGSGSGGAFENHIVLATNASLNEGVVPLAVLPVPGGIIPNPGVVIGPTVVTIPAGTEPGSYWIGVRLDAGNALAEEDEENNVASTMLTVVDPDPTLDQQQPIIDEGAAFAWGIGGGPNSEQKLAQVFTAGRSGLLSSVDLAASCSEGSDLVVEIRSVVEGEPSATVLATQIVPAGQLPSQFPQPTTFRTVTFDSPASVIAGTQYALVLSTAGSCGTPPGPENSYAGGNLFFDARPNTPGVWLLIGTRDLPFKTRVVDAPIALVSCVPQGAGGDLTFRGFYLSSYPGSVLSGVELYLVSSTGGTFNLTLTARSGTYDGAVIGTSNVAVTLPEGSANVPALFQFPNSAVTPGSLVTFSITQAGSGSLFYNVQTSTAGCPITQTNGTEPPLDTFRRNGIAVKIMGRP